METNIFFGSNVKFLRIRQKLTQENLAAKLSISRSKLNCIEMGQTKSPTIQDMLNFSSYFKMSLDTLIKIDLTTIGELRLRELENGNDIYLKGGNLRVLAITVDKDNKENVEFVPIKAKAGYQAGYNDPEFIASLPKYSIPNLPSNATYRIFPTEGDSMLPIPENSEINCQYIQDWLELKPQTPCIVILKNNRDFVFKMVTLMPDGKFLLESLNKEYQPYYVETDDVLELWKFYSFTSTIIPSTGALNDLWEEIKDLKKWVKKLRPVQ